VSARNLRTPDEMAGILGWEGEASETGRATARSIRLLAYLKAREKQLGEPLMIRLGEGRGRRYRISESLLRMRCPELWGQSIDEMHAAFSAHLASLDGKIDRRVDERVAETVLPRLDEITERQEALAGAVSQVSSQQAADTAELEAEDLRLGQQQIEMLKRLERIVGL